MKFTIYKTVNKLNGKYYIGMHRTNNPNDKYLGSGLGIKRAVNKYGAEMFEKEVMHIFDNESDMIEKEKELITDSVISDPNSYNMKPGGLGGFSHVDTTGENNGMYGRSWKDGKTQEEIDLINSKKGSPGEKNYMFGRTHTEEAREKIREHNKQYNKTPEGIAKIARSAASASRRFKGVPKTEEQKRKMSIAAKARWDNAPILKCPHCNKESKQGGAMKRHHFDNCKHRR